MLIYLRRQDREGVAGKMQPWAEDSNLRYCLGGTVVLGGVSRALEIV